MYSASVAPVSPWQRGQQNAVGVKGAAPTSCMLPPPPPPSTTDDGTARQAEPIAHQAPMVSVPRGERGSRGSGHVRGGGRLGCSLAPDPGRNAPDWQQSEPSQLVSHHPPHPHPRLTTPPTAPPHLRSQESSPPKSGRDQTVPT